MSNRSSASSFSYEMSIEIFLAVVICFFAALDFLAPVPARCATENFMPRGMSGSGTEGSFSAAGRYPRNGMTGPNRKVKSSVS